MNARILLPIAMIAIAALLGGCATTNPTGLEGLKANQLQRLTMACYLDHHDAGIVTNGYGPVWLACKDRARSQVPSGSVLTAAQPQ